MWDRCTHIAVLIAVIFPKFITSVPWTGVNFGRYLLLGVTDSFDDAVLGASNFEKSPKFSYLLKLHVSWREGNARVHYRSRWNRNNPKSNRPSLIKDRTTAQRWIPTSKMKKRPQFIQKKYRTYLIVFTIYIGINKERQGLKHPKILASSRQN